MSLKALPIVLVIAGLSPAVSTLARAQDNENPSYTMEDVTACSNDAMRICQDKMPDIRAIESCMEQNYDKLSRRCQARFKR